MDTRDRVSPAADDHARRWHALVSGTKVAEEQASGSVWSCKDINVCHESLSRLPASVGSDNERLHIDSEACRSPASTQAMAGPSLAGCWVVKDEAAIESPAAKC